MDDAMFNDLTRSLEQAAAHARGETVPGLHVHVHVPREVDVAAIRKATDLSQDVFARRIGVAVGTLRNWEQGRRKPEGPARVLLALLERNPRLVEETLGAQG
ncbi:helix-turn-helix domain-containing protein [Methylobacterium ajmalii]|uniref:Helix-turn-helix domain-containing protein n=1 Tax=Methylobacterium ajmalii TaxID=2738439 RepID=A0ABV0A288_9HYPH